MSSNTGIFMPWPRAGTEGECLTHFGQLADGWLVAFDLAMPCSALLNLFIYFCCFPRFASFHWIPSIHGTTIFANRPIFWLSAVAVCISWDLLTLDHTQNAVLACFFFIWHFLMELLTYPIIRYQFIGKIGEFERIHSEKALLHPSLLIVG